MDFSNSAIILPRTGDFLWDSGFVLQELEGESGTMPLLSECAV